MDALVQANALSLHPPDLDVRVLRCAGVNGRESVITPALLRAGRFGRIGTFVVQGAVYAHPLVVAGLSIGGRTVTGVIVATMDNFVCFLYIMPCSLF